MKFVAKADGQAVTPEDRGVFTLTRRGGGAILRKILPPDTESNLFHMAFVYEDTATLRPEEYLWSFKVVRNGVFNADGRLEETQGQHTAVLRGKLHVMPTAGGAR